MHHRRLAGLAIGSSLPPLQHLPQRTPQNLLPNWEVTFDSAGRLFVATVRAVNTEAAAAEALIELAHRCPDFDTDRARAVACKQVL